MTGIEEKQTCPFCDADWGFCDHYRVLSEWEEHATETKAASRSKTRIVIPKPDPSRQGV